MKYGYDGATISGCTQPVLSDPNPKGRRTAMCDGSGSTAWSHEVMGRVSIKKQKIDTFNQSTVYTYNLDGSINTETYPTAHVLSYGYNNAGRPISLTDTTASINYMSACSTAPCYAPQGALQQARFGVTGSFAGITVQNNYNKRLQPTLISATTPAPATVLSLSYDLHLGSGDNGNVFQIANGKDSNRTQNFLYDPLNRIQQAYTSGTNWGETFSPTATAPGVAPTTPGIDPWGNLTNRSGVTGKTTYEPLSAPATNQNRLTSFGYDAAGNMTSNGSATYTYDAENHLISAGGYTYSYDGDGNRVKKTDGSTGTIYWRDAGGEVVVDANLAGTSQNEYIFFGGKRVARRDVPTGHKHYYFSDHLGSASVITSDLGVIQEESDYYPYGGEIAITNGDPNTYKFTGKERDSESGLDNFGARYNTSSLGRFMTPDLDNDVDDPGPVPYASLRDPQTLNLYSYVRNNPLNGIDPDGHKTVCTSTSSSDAQGNIKVVVTCHEEPDPPPPTVADQVRTLFQSDVFDSADKQAIGMGLIRDVVTGKANWGNLNDYLPQTPTNSQSPPPPTIPLKALKVLDAIAVSGSAGPNIQGGKNFKNDGRGGGQVLPPTDGHGNAITYREWDVNPAGGQRGAERVVTGSDGSEYYTSDHYHTFEKVR